MKKNFKKRIISMCMIMVLLLGMCTHLVGCGKQAAVEDTQTEFEKDPNAIYLTRGEWIQGLAQTAGYTDSMTEEPYFTDIPSDHELFSYIQSAADWELFETVGGEFAPDADATREFVIATAVIAANALEDAGYIEQGEKADYETCIQFSFDNGNIEQTDEAFLAEPVTVEEGQDILDWASLVYKNPLITEEEKVELEEGVVDFRETTEGITVTENTVVFDASLAANLKEGDVFLLPATEEVPYAVAKKVVAVTTNDAGEVIAETTQPQLGEVFEELSIRQIVSLDEAIIKPAEGVTIIEEEAVSSSENEYRLLRGGGGGGGHGGADKGRKFYYDENGDKITKIINNEKLEADDKHFDIKIKIGDKGVAFVHEVGEAQSKVDVMLRDMQNTESQKAIKDFLDGCAYLAEGGSLIDLELSNTDSYEENSIEITGTGTLRDMYALVDLRLKEDGILDDIERANVTLNYRADLDVGFKGEYRNEVPIAELIFPVCGICALEGTAYVYLNGNGELQLGITTGTNTSIGYEDGKGFRFTTEDYSEPWKPRVRLSAETGVGLSASLSVVAVDVLKCGVDGGARLTYNVYTEPEIATKEIDGNLQVTNRNYLCVKGNVTFPVITVYAKMDVLIAEAEKKSELIGPKGTQKKLKGVTLLDERILLAEESTLHDENGNELYANLNEKLEEFLYAPEKAYMAFSNFYKKEGAATYIASLGLTPNAEEATNILGLYMRYSDEPRYYVDGRVEEGADLYYRNDVLKADLFYSFTNLKYNETDLQEVKTHILDIDNMANHEIPRVSGFSGFLYDYQCKTTADVVEVLDLGEDVLAAVNAEEEYYVTEVTTNKFGTVKIEVDSSVAMYGDFYSKTVYLTFEEDSASPYEMVVISEGFPANYMGELKTLQVTGYTKYND